MSAATKSVRAATRTAKVATPKVTATKAGRPKAAALTVSVTASAQIVYWEVLDCVAALTMFQSPGPEPSLLV